MSDNKKVESNEDIIKENVYDLSRKVLMAAIGAAAIAQDEISGFVDHLAERGELAEKDAHGLLKEILDRREKIIKERRAEFRPNSHKPATKEDVEDLKAKINELNRQIEELKKS